MTKRKGQSITIRLDDALAEKLQTVATRHNVARSAVIVDLLLGGLGEWQPGTTEWHDQGTTQRHDQGTTLARLDELATAIEELRSGLDGTIERIDRIERRAIATPGRRLYQVAFALGFTQKLDDRNYDTRCKKLYGLKFCEYLLSQGWTQQGRQWFEPVGKT